MKIILLDADTIGQVSNLNRFENFGEFIIYPNTYPDVILERVQDCDVIITNKVEINRKVIEQARQLQLICISATGTNNVDLACARERGIVVKNVEDYSTHSVAQHTFALLLMLLNQVRYYDLYVKTGAYSSQFLFTHMDRPISEIRDKRFGIIGLGNIGRQVAAIAESFGAEIVYYSSTGQSRHDRYTLLDLETLLSTSDIVSVHAPLNDKTRNLISFDQLKMMKKNALLINTGRGGIINEKDLAEALDEDLIQGAGIDVYTEEPISLSHPLMQLEKKEKIILTPHMAWTSQEARNLLMEKVYQNIETFIKEKNR